ncbi:D-alanyl-D-alanine carboxypeptidase [Lutibaculum baratangense]|uniref:D-alanyl-D-alanine carboxypeptidase n=1 Tax=Lutibaculum baratangense AMV1 TaxID=631454 RepID=V4RBP6_9HYPH|nr:D-alanyl-D-alanine carboxypeptidase [Lutibaculum baratangense]ESR23576.1 D-alanyl-D-alanine carboxypeptidase [Lutibaculum baratangense AMV1]
MIGVLPVWNPIHRLNIFRALMVLVALLSIAAAPADANERYAAYIIDANTNEVLFSRNGDVPRYPASITKVMTLFIVFEELEAGRLRLDTPLKVSAAAAAEPPSKIGVKPGSTITVEDAIKAMLTKSANDVAHVVAENIGGSVPAFAQRMTRTARSIGMTKTTFANPHGLPNSNNISTARDLAILGQVTMRRFPNYFGYFSIRSFTYKGQTYGNHNKLLGRVAGVDGFKTGYIRASGFNLLATMQRGDRRIIGVVMGGQSGSSRDAHMRELLEAHIKRSTPSAAPLLASNAPLPPVRPERPVTTMYVPSTTVPGTMVSASAAPMPYFPASGDPIGQKIEIALSEEAVSGQGDASPLDEVTTASLSPGSDSWVIQVGAFNGEALAMSALSRAQERAPSVLRNASAYTETVKLDGETYWRARFAGFDRGGAEAACTALKRASFGCFPARN